MSDYQEEILLEEAVSAYRERTTSGRILSSPAWWDMPVESRELLFAKQLQSRVVERAVSSDGMSSTVRSIFNRIIAL